MILVHSNENQDKEWRMWSNTKKLITLKSNNSNNFNEKDRKIIFSSNDDLPLNKSIELHNTIIVIGSVFHKDVKY